MTKLETIKFLSENGRIFSVKFTKRDGAERKMVCRYIEPLKQIEDCVVVYEFKSKQLRSFKPSTLIEIRGRGEIIKCK